MQRATNARDEWHIFLTALMFLTRLPVPKHYHYDERWLGWSTRYFPLVGLLVGAIGAAVYWLSQPVFPNVLAILLSMMATVLVTGAFHEDGFADCCDGLGGGLDRNDALRIMKDSRVGSYALVGLGLLLACKGITLASMAPEVIAVVLIAGHGISRWVSIGLIRSLDYVRDDHGKSKPLATELTTTDLSVAAVTVTPVVLCLLYWLSLPVLLILILIMWLTQWLATRYFRRRLGGYTGDCLGAVQQVAEVIFYLGFLALF